MSQQRFYSSSALPTTLTAALGASGNPQVAGITGLPSSYPFTILIDWGNISQEAISVTGAPTGTGPWTLPCTRGIDGTTAQSHLSGAVVVHGVTAQDFTQPSVFIDSLTGTAAGNFPQVFSPMAFGAAGNGTTDDTTAIQTAINTALGLRTDTGVSMSGFSVTDPAAVSGDVGKYVNSPNYQGGAPGTQGCSLITAVTSSPVGYTVATAATASLTGQAVGIGFGSSVTSAAALGPVFVPSGTYKISSDLLIQSSSGFAFIGAGANSTTLLATGHAFTTAVVNIDGSLDGRYGGFQVRGDGTEGTAVTGTGGGIPCGLNLTWTTAAQRSTTGNTLYNIRVRNLLFTTGVSLAGVGTRQLDGTYMQDIAVAGQQVKGGWSTSARTDTGLCGTNSTTTVTDTAAATADLGLPISGPGIPANTTITLVTPTVGYTISHAATATASPVTFTVGTNFWQAGYAFGNGGAGNIYDQVATACGAGGCYYGYKVLESGFALTGAQPGGNAADFYIIPNAQTTITNVQSQASGQLVVGPGSGSAIPVSFRDIEFAGWTGSTAGSGTPNYNPAWISIGTSYGNWVFENLKYSGALVSGNPPVIDCGSSDYAACFTLINVSAPVEPAIGIVPGSFGSFPADTAAVIAINWQDTASGRVLYPWYSVNSAAMFRKGLSLAMPAVSGSGSYGELWYYATDTQVLWHSDGWAWTAIQAFTGGTLASYLAPAVVTLTDGATIPVNAALGSDFRLTLTGSGHTLSSPTFTPGTQPDGQKIVIQVTQPASGGPYTIAYGTAYEFSTGIPSPTLSISASYTDLLGFIYNAAKGKWLLCAYVNGYA